MSLSSSSSKVVSLSSSTLTSAGFRSVCSSIIHHGLSFVEETSLSTIVASSWPGSTNQGASIRQDTNSRCTFLECRETKPSKTIFPLPKVLNFVGESINNMHEQWLVRSKTPAEKNFRIRWSFTEIIIP
ncbi:hypothetical protein Bca4012_049676 [Brassica carinata]